MNAPIRILGLDPGLRRTGWGVIDCAGTRISHVAHGVIAPKDTLPFSERLLCLFTGIEAVLNAYGPHEAAVEETFMNNNAQSALKLGHARAMAMIVPARAGLVVAEYAATVVKKAVVGTGSADKAQVGWMIARLLPTAGKTASEVSFDIGNPYRGPTETNIDLWLGYGRKNVFRGIDWRVQLNVRNVGQHDSLIPITTQPNGVPAGFRIAPVETWSVSNVFKF